MSDNTSVELDEHDDDLDFGDVSDVEEDTTEDGDIEGTGDAALISGQLASEELLAESGVTVLTDEQKAEQAAAAEAEAKAKAEQEERELQEALTEFKSVADGTLSHEGRDVTTGELPVAVIQLVKDAYVKVPGAKGKAAARQYLQDSMQEKMVAGATEGDTSLFVAARTYMQLHNEVKDAKGTRTDGAVKPKVSPTEAFVERISALMIAPNLVQVPEDVEDGWQDKVEALVAKLAPEVVKYRDWQTAVASAIAEHEASGADDSSEPTLPEEPKVSPVIVAAAKAAAGRASSVKRKTASAGTTSSGRPSTAGSGHTGNIATHIREAMDTVEVGQYLSISEIVNVPTSQYGKDGAPKPSAGAVSARLFPKGDPANCNLDFVRPEGREQGRDKKGAVRTK